LSPPRKAGWPRALASGAHLLLEKPAATDPAILPEMAGHCRSGQHATVFLTRLFNAQRAAWLRGAIGGGFDRAQVVWISSTLRPGTAYAHSKWRRDAGIVWDLMPHILSQLIPVLGDVSDASVHTLPEKDSVMIALEHTTGTRSEVHATLTADPAEKAEWIRFSGKGGETMSPAEPIDTPRAFRVAIDTILHGTDLNSDPVLRHATLDAAIAPATIMAALVSSLDRSDDGTRGKPTHASE